MSETQSSDLQIFREQFMTQANVKRYNYWRIRTLYSCVIGYATFYLVRQNFSMAVPSLKEEFGYTDVAFGSIFTLFSLVYGAGKLLNGYFSDKSDARYFLSIGLFLSAVTTFFAGFASGLVSFGLFLLLNGWFQSMGWPPISRMLSYWFSPKELGTKYAIANTSHQIGGAILPILAGYLIAHYGWRYAFFIPAMIAVFVAFFLFNRLRDNPAVLDLPPVEHYKNCVSKDTVIDESRITIKEAFKIVICNKLIWYVGIADFFLYIVRMGVFNWAPLFLKEFKGANIIMAGWQIAGYEIAGLFGGIAAGWISDKIFKGRRGPVAVFYMLMLTLALIYLWKIPAGYDSLNAIALMLVGFLVYGPQLLVGVAMTDFGTKRAVGVANGVANSLAALGTAFSGIGIAWIKIYWGWDGGFIFFIASALLGAFFFGLTWHHRSKVLEH